VPKEPGHRRWRIVKARPGDARVLARETRIMELREQGDSLKAIGEN